MNAAPPAANMCVCDVRTGGFDFYFYLVAFLRFIAACSLYPLRDRSRARRQIRGRATNEPSEITYT